MKSLNRRVLGLLVVVGVGLAGCGGGGEVSAVNSARGNTDRKPVSAAELAPFDAASPKDVAGPHSPMGGGLVVPGGAALLGAAFPDIKGGGFKALLLVTGDMPTVHEELVVQARRLGMDGSNACAPVGDGLGCVTRLADSNDGEQLSLNGFRQVSPDSVISTVAVDYRPPGTGDTAGNPAATASIPGQGAVQPELPRSIPPVDPSDLGAGYAEPSQPQRKLERGSVLVVGLGSCPCPTTGWSFVVRLDGVSRDVIAAYGRQFSDLGEVPNVDESYNDGITLTNTLIGDENKAEIRGYLPDNETGYVLISVFVSS